LQRDEEAEIEEFDESHEVANITMSMARRGDENATPDEDDEDNKIEEI
jgi:hypothetical protein